MPLTLVSEVLTHGGYLPQLAQLEQQPGTIYTRRNGVVFSLFWLIFWLLIMAVIFGGILNISRLGELFSVVGIFGGLLIFLFSLFFLKSGKKPNFSGIQHQQPAPSLYGQQQQSLPPQPARDYVHPGVGSWRDTSDLEPTSVTENTTKLLEKDEQPPQ